MHTVIWSVPTDCYFLELYELTDQFAPSKETSASSSEAPAVPSRDKTPPEKPSTAPPAHAQEEEEFEKMDDDGMEDYQLPDASAPKPGMMACQYFKRFTMHKGGRACEAASGN